MIESILRSVTKMLGMTEDYEHFDHDIIIHINSVFVDLYELGVGDRVFQIEDDTSKWSDFITDERLNYVQQYVFLKVRLVFDPPTSSFVLTSIEDKIKELEWRINVMVDKDTTFDTAQVYH